MRAIRILSISLALLFSGAVAADTAVNESSKDNNVHVARGKAISMEELTAIADLSSARDEGGNPVTIDEGGEYSIGSFTRATVTVVPVNGNAKDVITLDLKQQPK